MSIGTVLTLSSLVSLEVGSYLLAEAFLSRCLSVLAEELRPENCLSFLSLSEKICCEELRTTVLTYLSRNLLELPHITRYQSIYSHAMTGLSS